MELDDVFNVHEGLASGQTRRSLRNPRWDASVYGVRAVDVDPSLEKRCRMMLRRVGPAAFISHSSAALLWGMPVPWRMKRISPIHVSLVSPARAPHSTGVAGHSLDIPASDIAERAGVRLTNPVRTWCDLAGILPLPDLVAAGDFVISARLPLATHAELHTALSSLFGRRGIRRSREALELLDGRAESAPESILRVLLVQGGLPTPTINHTIIDTETGKEMRPDFRFENERVLLEYQGDYHRSKEQWRKNMTRRARLEALGWRVMELNWDDLKHPDELIARILLLFTR